MDNRENRIPGSPRSQSAGWHMNGGSRTEPKSAGEAGAARASGDAGNCGAIRVPEECAADAVLREYHRLEWEMTPLAGMQAARAFALLQVLSACAFEQAYGIRADRLLKGRSVVSGQGAEVDTQVLNQAARYEQTPMSDEAHASLERDVQNFGAEVDRIVAVGKPPSQQVKMLGQAPLVLQLVVDPKTALGKAVAQGGLYASPHVFGGKHPNITPDILKKIPAAMVDPIAIFDSQTQPGDLVFMLEITDQYGATTVVPVALSKRSDYLGADINLVKTAYTKERKTIPQNEWFKDQTETNLRYVNIKKMEHWQASSGVQFPFVHLINAPDRKVYTKDSLVNARTQYTGMYQSDQAKQDSSVRGQVDLTDPDKAVIRVFKGSDLSTIPHETAHIVLRDLLTVAGDDGSIARGRLREDLKAAGLAPAPFAGLLDGSLSVDDARAMLRGTRDALTPLGRTISDVRDSSRRTHERLCQSGWQAEPMDMQVREQDRTRRRHLLAEERVLADFVRHMDGLEQAGRDVRTLRRFAGLPEEGPLTSGQYRELQEFTARGFEQYLSEGKAPSPRLTGLFARMEKWLKNLYAS